MSSIENRRVPKVRVRKVETSPYVIDQSKLRRFNSRNMIFDRVMWDSSWEGYTRMYDAEVLDIVSEGKSGYSRVDFALAYASWIVHDAFKGGVHGRKSNCIEIHQQPSE